MRARQLPLDPARHGRRSSSLKSHLAACGRALRERGVDAVAMLRRPRQIQLAHTVNTLRRRRMLLSVPLTTIKKAIWGGSVAKKKAPRRSPRKRSAPKVETSRPSPATASASEPSRQLPKSLPPGKRLVNSLLDAMKDGREYESLVDCVPSKPLDLKSEFSRALADIEAIRGRPALLYAGNIISTQGSPHIGISNFDELPFAEMVDQVPATARSVDVIVVTPGGSAQSVSYFVDKLRSRFDHVSFLIPYACMSAGTIWVLSGDEIWMDERAYLGPIDPQVVGREGRFVHCRRFGSCSRRSRKTGKQLSPRAVNRRGLTCNCYETWTQKSWGMLVRPAVTRPSLLQATLRNGSFVIGLYGSQLAWLWTMLTVSSERRRSHAALRSRSLENA